MITASNIFVKYGDRILLDHINLVVQKSERIGLVGRNGAGKSTLLKIIAGYQSAHHGNVTRPSEATLGFLHQEMELPKGRSVIEETLTAFEETRRLEQKLQTMQEEIGQREDYESADYLKLVEEYADLNDRFQMLGGASMEGKAEKVLKGLGFKQSDFVRQTTEFSGGWQMRIELAKMLLQQPDYLLLDEPTNHLDIESIIWLEKFLRTYPGAVIVISHDKQFLDHVTERTVEIELGKVYDYKAPYSKYLALRADRMEKQRAAYENQQKVIAQKERTINRFMAKATKTKMAQSMQKQLDKMERIELDQTDSSAMNLHFPPAPRSGEVVVEAKDVVKRYGDLLVLDHVGMKIHRGEKVAFVGQNGQGKTTLAKILIDELKATDGDVNLGHNVQIGYYAQNQSEALESGLTVLETMEQESPAEMRTQLRSILGAFMFSGEDAEKKVSVLSGGERARLALACLLLHPFNLLVLDEPTNHLDIPAKEVLKEALLKYNGAMIIVSHDRDFLAGLTEKTIEFRDRQLFEYLGDVNYFLDKRSIDDMRTLEQGSGSGSSASEKASAKPQISYEERKRLLRDVSKAEKKVEQLEADLAMIEAQMAEESFYEKPNAEKVMRQYGEKKKALEQAMEAWEAAQLAWEEVGE